jgi:hypothetical protein
MCLQFGRDFTIINIDSCKGFSSDSLLEHEKNKSEEVSSLLEPRSAPNFISLFV